MSAPTPAASVAGSTTGSRDYSALRWLVLATFIVFLNETIIVNALPQLQSDFDVTARAAQWLTTAFLLTMAVVIPITGWFLQRVTTRAAFTISMVTFCSGTLLAALAPSFEVLLAARVTQAVGTAVMMPLLMTTLMTIVAEEDRGRIMGNVTLAMSVAPALGPVVSGVILQFASWRWMFGAVLPIAMVITAVGLKNLRNVGEPEPGSIDVPSVLLSALGFGPLVYGLSQIGGKDEAYSPIWPIALGCAMVGVFVWRQIVLQRTDKPLLDLRALKIRTFAIGLALMSVAFMAFLGSLILLPQYLQRVQGLTALQTGLLVAPGGLAMGLLGPQVGKIYDRIGARPLLVPGSGLIVLALAFFTQLHPNTPIPLILAAHIALMLGLAAVFTPVFTLSLGALPEHLYSHGSSILGALQQVAGAMGTAICIAVLSSRSSHLTAIGQDTKHALSGGMQWAFAVGAALSLIVLVLAALMPNRVPGGDQHDPAEESSSEEDLTLVEQS